LFAVLDDAVLVDDDAARALTAPSPIKSATGTVGLAVSLFRSLARVMPIFPSETTFLRERLSTLMPMTSAFMPV